MPVPGPDRVWRHSAFRGSQEVQRFEHAYGRVIRDRAGTLHGAVLPRRLSRPVALGVLPLDVSGECLRLLPEPEAPVSLESIEIRDVGRLGAKD